jgi:hypothetical protein
MSNSTVDIQGQLVTIDNLLQGLNYLYEEISSRKDKMMSQDSIRAELNEIVLQEDFINSLTGSIIRWYGGSDILTHYVSLEVMKRIDNDIEAFLENRIDKYLESKLQN